MEPLHRRALARLEERELQQLRRHDLVVVRRVHVHLNRRVEKQGGGDAGNMLREVLARRRRREHHDRISAFVEGRRARHPHARRALSWRAVTRGYSNNNQLVGRTLGE